MARSLPRLTGAAYAIAAVTLILDQLSKWWVLEGLKLQQGSIPVGPIRFSMVWNTGFSFGLLRDGAEIGRWALTAFSALVAVLLGRWAMKVDRPLLAVAIGLIMGGAIGNMIDRIRLAAVADFIDVSPLLPFFPWVFNVADSGITIGVILLLVDTVASERSAAVPKA
ncbi:MAG: signal peptidase II [Caulobacterales bacterium 68-7]|nr:MAG: signal peptidase II [Caulobacterales bacterium 68-7]